MAWSAVLNVPSVEYATIQSAVTAAQTGDTVSVSGGPYTEDVWINNVSQNRDGITISGPGVTLNGGFFIEQPNGAGSDDVTIDGFTIEGGGFTGSIRNGIRVHASNARILNCTIGGVTGSQSRAIETSRPSDGLLIEGCRILASNLNGLYLNAADRVVCRGNYFEKGIGSDGLTNFLAEYNVFSGSSFGCGPGGSSIQLHYNDFINNSGRAVTWYKEGSATGDFDAENNWWGSVNGPSDALGTTETDGSSDPGVATGLNIDPAGALGAVVSDALANWSTQAGTNHIDYIPWSTGPNNISLVVDDVTCGKNQTAELKATLTNNGVGVVGKLITFSVDGSAAGTGTTDGNGVATADYVVTQGLGDYVIQARFAGDASTLPATGYGTLSVPVPNVVWVDDDFTATGANGGHVWGYDAFATIQNGINAVNDGGTVNVLAGTYTGAPWITKTLALMGPNAGVNPNSVPSARVDEAVVQLTGAEGWIQRLSDGVTIDGFTFTPSTWTCMAPNAVAALTLCNNIFTSGVAFYSEGPDAFTNLSIINNLMNGPGGFAITIGSVNGALIKGNVMQDRQSGINLAGTPECKDVSIIGNTFRNMTYKGMNLAYSQNNITVSNNTMDNIRGSGTSCIFVYGTNPAWPSLRTGPITITGNTFTNNYRVIAVPGGFRIDDQPFTVAGNSFDAANDYFIYQSGLGLISAPASSNTYGDGSLTDDQIEAQVWHLVDDPALGFVDWGQGTPVATALVAFDASGNVGDSVPLSARLTCGGVPMAGQTVGFTVGAWTASAVTDPNGLAKVTYDITEAGNKQIVARFAGLADYISSQDEAALTVTSVPTEIFLSLSDYDILAGETTTATVLDQNDQDITALCSLTIESGAGGGWGGAQYTSEFAGTWRVTAIYGGLTDSVDLTVLHGAATDLDIAPDAATIGAGESQTYSVVATDGSGNTWTPDAGALNWDAGAGAGTFTDYTYTSVAGDAGKTLDIQATLGTLPSDVAKLTVNPLDGAGLILAWDKDTRGFYLCANPANPAGSVANPAVAVNASGIYDIDGDLVGDVTVVVSGTATNRTVSVTNSHGITNKLQVRYYLRGSGLLFVYMYSTIGATQRTAVYWGPVYGNQTLVDDEYKAGLWGLTHELDAGDPTSITYGASLQP